MNPPSIAIIGCGAFGFALTDALARAHPSQIIRVTDADPVIREKVATGEHPYFFPGHKLPPNITVLPNSREAVQDARIVILAVPAQIVRHACADLVGALRFDAVLLNTAKALEGTTAKRLSTVVHEVLPDVAVAAIGGGMLAHDVLLGKVVGAEISCEDEHALHALASVFKGTSIAVETTTDVVGVEYGSAFKNVIAIGAGIIDGLGWGNSTKAYFIAQSLREIETLAVKLGARQETFHTASSFWIGDLMASCFGDGRNRYFGELVGKGQSPEAAAQTLRDAHKHAEGIGTLTVVTNLLREHKVNAPLMMRLQAIIHESAPPTTLLQR